MTRPLACIVAVLVSSAATDEQTSRFRTRTDLVRVDVLVTDGCRPIGGLRAEDLELRDDGGTQRIDRVLTREDRIDAWLLLDESGSVRHDLDALVALVRAAWAFASGLGPATARVSSRFDMR